MISIRVNKGYDLNLDGEPATALASLENPRHVAVLPERIRFVKPRLAVSVGDAVNVGSVLFTDKRNPDIKFLSPGGGRVTDIVYGRRRVIRRIVIALDSEESFETFDAVGAGDLPGMDRSRLIALLMAGGLWPLLRQLPYRDLARPDETPPALIVTLGNLEPFTPRVPIYLAENREMFEFGLKALEILAQGRLSVVAAAADLPELPDLAPVITHTYRGAYPAHDPGVLTYHTKTDPKENRAWYVDAQDVLLIAHLLKTGTYPTERTVVVAGSGASSRQHYKTRLGAPLVNLVPDQRPGDDCRFVVGGLLTGTRSEADAYLGLHDTSLVLLPEGNFREFMGFARPGYRKPSFSRAFLSWLNPAPLRTDCNTHGELRACIACNHCPRVCPVDILPQLTYKALKAGDVEEALAHGLLDCVECGLCTYVCPAKIELTQALVSAKAAYYKEQTSS